MAQKKLVFIRILASKKIKPRNHLNNFYYAKLLLLFFMNLSVELLSTLYKTASKINNFQVKVLFFTYYLLLRSYLYLMLFILCYRCKHRLLMPPCLYNKLIGYIYCAAAIIS